MKYGKRPAVRPPRLATASAYAVGRLPAAPTSVAAPQLSWGMDLNDTLGDCTIAGVAHLLLAWNADRGAKRVPPPTDDEIRQTYFGLTGGPDSGLVEFDVLRAWYREGLFGHECLGFAPVEQTIPDLCETIATFGGVYLGIACPASAQQDFAAHRPWTWEPDSPTDGGHCIVGVGYTPTAMLCVSWGQLVEVTWPFLAHYLDEAWAVIGPEFAGAVDLPSLRRDLALV